MPDYQTVLDFWFGHEQSNVATSAQMSPLWWSGDAAVDEDIRRRFNATIEALVSGDLDSWCVTPYGRLAAIIVADQFSRNVHRGTARAFAQDVEALALTLEGIDQRMDNELRLIERKFFYMPLEHSESLTMQEKSLEMFKALLDTSAEDEKELFQGSYDFAVRHWQVIKRFGRFPHRNAVLGRKSTVAELAYLEEPGSSF